MEDISNFNEISDLMYIFFGILTVDVVVLFLTRFYKVGGKYLNEWYDQFNILAVLADIMIIFIGFLITRYLYTYFFFAKFEFNPIIFMVLLIVVQLLHDLLFYFGIIKIIPYGNNEMMDTFKRYAGDLGGIILGGDALLMIGSAFTAMLYKGLPLHAFISIISIVVYALPYILFTRNPFTVKQIKEDKKSDVRESNKENEESINMKRFFNMQGEM
jgi:hypothetical protein